MDPVSQAVLGGAIVEAGFRDRLGRNAGWYGAACGAAPDLDIVTMLWGDWTFLAYHRGATHSLLILPAIALGCGWLGHRFARTGSLGAWTAAALAALLSHPLLDWGTSYGTQLLWPLSDGRFALDAIAVIDPLYTLPLLVAFVVARRRRAHESSIRRAAWIALAVSSLYAGFGFWQSRIALERGHEALTEAGVEVAELRATPTLFNTIVWRLTARDATGDLVAGFVSTLASHPPAYRRLAKASHPLAERALASDEGRLFSEFAQGFVHVELEPRPGGGHAVHLIDVRYNFLTALRSSPFEAMAEFDADGRLLSVTRARRLDSMAQGAKIREELAMLVAVLGGRAYEVPAER